MPIGWIIAAALPWALVPIALLWRLRDTVELDAYPVAIGADGERVSVILPARDEAVHIEACMRSILASRYPDFELIVVDDHSSDGTGEIARRVAAEDSRARVVTPPELPEGWFGKQWACHSGAGVATGRVLLFTDADTRHGAECLPRAVNAMRIRRADLFSVAGQQEMVSFWERLLQPHIFMLILARYGGTERISRATSPYAKIANGQYLMITREAYDRVGGHAAVREHVAEDLRLAQSAARAGLSVQLVAGLSHLSTRMYDGLGALMRGWGKNVWAAGRDTLPLGSVGRAVLRVIFPLPALWEIAPPVVGALALAGIVAPAYGWWALCAYTLAALGWVLPHRASQQPLWYSLLHPLAASIVFWIFATAAWRGDRVEWKGRTYRSR